MLRVVLIGLAATLAAPIALAGPAERVGRVDYRLDRLERTGVIQDGSRADFAEDRFDRFEDRVDRREDVRDRSVNLGPRDVAEDRRDTLENRYDRRESRRDRRN